MRSSEKTTITSEIVYSPFRPCTTPVMVKELLRQTMKYPKLGRVVIAQLMTKLGISMSHSCVKYWWRKYGLLKAKDRLAFQQHGEIPPEIHVGHASANPKKVTIEDQFVPPDEPVKTKPSRSAVRERTGRSGCCLWRRCCCRKRFSRYARDNQGRAFGLSLCNFFPVDIRIYQMYFWNSLL